MDEWLFLNGITSLKGGFYHGCIVIFGLLAGSLINVVVYRIPIAISHPERFTTGSFNLCFPSSHCPTCKHTLRYWQNIPVLSWMVLKGRCHYCHNAIPASYPLTEGICATGFFALSWILSTPTALCAALILFWFLLALSLIDLSTSLLPDSLTLSLLWIGLLVPSFSENVTLQGSVYGAASGYLSLWFLYWVVKIITGKEGMGHGDFKLLAALGAWVGWQALPHLCILAALTGMIFALISSKGDRVMKQIPFGPSLASAGFIVYISQQSESVWLMFL
jgi:leader peptidase (prepilin peptidase)/N-methyltransferase